MPETPLVTVLSGYLNEKCCENCGNNRSNKYESPCSICTLNPMYRSHFTENETIKQLKLKISEAKVKKGDKS